jgi:hypothetical protein
MDIAQARKIGGKKAALGFVWMLLLFEGMTFYLGTKVEFGIRTFVDMNIEPVFDGLVVLLFVTVFITGRMAGKRIIIDGKDHMMTAGLFWAITAAIGVAYIWVVSMAERFDMEERSKVFIGFALYVGCIWLIAVRGIKRAGR